MNYAFDEDHASIVFSKEVLAQYNTILDKFDGKQGGALDQTGGYLKVHFEYRYEIDGIRPGPTLILRPVGKKDADTVVFLNAGNNDRILGPFPSGDYVASMVALAAKPEQNDLPVTIEGNGTKDLSFVFTPDGVICGCVTTSLSPEDKAVGMPDYRYRPVDNNINIQSIELNGNGNQRILRQVKGEDINNGS
jgi:hypothetical protein